MKKFKWCAQLLSLCTLVLGMGMNAQAQEKESVFQEKFDSPTALQNWVGDKDAVTFDAGPAGGRSIKIERAPALGVGSKKIVLQLPVDNLRGTRLACSAQVKTSEVVKPAAAYNGVKFMLHIVSPSSDDWPQQQHVHGTFDWKKLEFAARIPIHATKVELVLGLEDTTGTAWFSDIDLKVLARTPRRPEQPAATGPRYTGHNLPRLRGTMISQNLSETDLRDLATWNVNHIRWPITWGDAPTDAAGKSDMAKYDAWLESALVKLDKMLPLCEELGINVTVDLHTPPGGRNPNNECNLFKDKRFQENFVGWWEKIAHRYKDKSVVWGYDLLNEPVEGPNDEITWHEIAAQAAKRVRAIDAKHAIIVEPAPWASPTAMEYFTPIEVPGIVYSVHMYDPHSFTHQGVGANPMGLTYPGLIEGRQWNKEQIRKVLQPVVDFQKAYNVHIYVGEFSSIRWAPNGSTNRYLRDVIDLFEEYNWDWAYHAFREYHGWSVEHFADKNVGGRTPTVTEGENMLRTVFAKNLKPAGSRNTTLPVPAVGAAKPNAVPVAAAPAAVAPTTVAITKEPFVRWLAIGDSITAHGPNQNLKWLGTVRGMAASTVENDYIHVLQRKLQAANPKNATELNVVGRLGKLSGGTIEQMNTVLEEVSAWKPDLVTIQLGENDRLNEIGKDGFEKLYRKLVDAFLTGPKRPTIVCTGVWQPSEANAHANLAEYPAESEARIKDDVIQAICREKGLIYVPIAPIATVPTNHGFGEVAGVRWHPNDAGMQGYADSIYKALYK